MITTLKELEAQLLSQTLRANCHYDDDDEIIGLTIRYP